MVPYYHAAMHLSDSQLCAAEDRCPICGGSDRSKLLRIQESPDVWLVNCRTCHGSSASRMPTAEALESYYGDFYARLGCKSDEDKTTFDEPLRLVRRIRSAIRTSLVGRRVDILDFGGGDGTISCLLAKSLLDDGACESARIVLVDVNEEASRKESSGIVVEKRNRLEEDGQQYDVVIASAVLEHIPSPREVLQGLLGSVRRGGIFYARTPYSAPLLRLIPLPPVRKLLFFPAHVHDMGQRFWENIVAVLGLSPSFRVLRSNPSIVETTFRGAFFRALVAHALKAPWYLFGKFYGLVGGWEVVIEKSE